MRLTSMLLIHIHVFGGGVVGSRIMGPCVSMTLVIASSLFESTFLRCPNMQINTNNHLGDKKTRATNEKPVDSTDFAISSS